MSNPLEGKRVVYAVAPGKSILTSKSIHLKAGAVVKPEDSKWQETVGLDQESIDSFLKKGLLVESIISAAGEVSLPPRDSVQTAAPTLPGSNTGEGIKMEKESSGAIIPPEGPTKSSPEGTSVGVFGYDPASLQGNSIKELNALVFGIDATVIPFETPPEAIAYLSSDFRTLQGSADRVTG